MRFVKNKILIVLAIFVFVLYLTNDFSLIDIKETALIVALGVDKTEEAYEVSAQIAIPQATDQTASNAQAVITGKGKTVAMAIENIGVRTGWYPKLSFCNVIIVGEGLLNENVMESLDYFLRSNRIQDTAELCVAEGKAKDLLTAASPLNELSAFSLIKILQDDAESASTVTVASLREFAMGYYSKSGFSMMPIIKLLKAENSNAENKGNQPAVKIINKKATAQRSGGDQGGESKEKIFDGTTTALFNKGKQCAVLNKEQTLAFNLLRHKINESSISLEDANYSDGEATLLIGLRDNKGKVRLKIDEGRPVLEVDLKLTAKIEDADVSVSPRELAMGYVVPDEVLKEIESKLRELLNEVFTLSRDCGCDAFEIVDRLYRTQNKYYDGLKSIILNECKIKVNVRAVSFR